MSKYTDVAAKPQYAGAMNLIFVTKKNSSKIIVRETMHTQPVCSKNYGYTLFEIDNFSYFGDAISLTCYLAAALNPNGTINTSVAVVRLYRS